MYPRMVLSNGLSGLIPVVLSWGLLVTSLVMVIRKKQQLASCFFAGSWFFVALALLASLGNLRIAMQNPVPDIGVIAIFGTSFLMITNYASVASIPVLVLSAVLSTKDRVRTVAHIITLLAFIVLMFISASLGKVVAEWGQMQLRQEQGASNK